jgi:hypothetical protein
MPKESTAALLMEGKTHLRLLQEIPLGEAEQAAVKDGVTAYENLLSKLADVPTPADRRRACADHFSEAITAGSDFHDGRSPAQS